MKWFKHMTSSADDEKLAALIGQGGAEGLALYGAYWRIAEIVAKQMEGQDPSCAVTYPVWMWTRLLFVRKSYLSSTLLRLKKERLLVVEGDLKVDQAITVRMPNLLKFRDEYTRKSGHYQDNVAPDTEGDTDTEAERTKPLASTAIAVTADRGKLLGTLPLNDGSEWEIYRADVELLQPLYPATDVLQELREMKGWLIGNPTNLKTRSGIKRFITSWLAKEQNKAKTGGSNGFKGKTESSLDALAQARAFNREQGSHHGSFGEVGRETAGEVITPGLPHPGRGLAAV